MDDADMIYSAILAVFGEVFSCISFYETLLLSYRTIVTKNYAENCISFLV